MTRFLLAALGVMAACGGSQVSEGPTDAAPETIDATSVYGARDGSTDGARPGNVGKDAGRIHADGGPLGNGRDSGTPDCAGQGSLPSTLACTGLYSDIASKTLAPGVQFYLPGVVLWSDGAQKSRWIQLPAGTHIDASNPNEWIFPVGTKVWKEFAKNGKRVETRLFQKVDPGPPPYWVHTTYAWNADESDAVTSGGGDITLDTDGSLYHIPTFGECEKCHNGRTDHILGFEQVALGLAGAQGLTLSELVKNGLIEPAPAQTQLSIGDDGTGAAAPAVGWLHINCGVCCHNGNSTAMEYGLGMRLRLDATLVDGRPLTVADFDPLRTTLGVPAASPGWIQPTQWMRIVPGNPNQSLLVQLISHRGTDNLVGAQMPPIGSLVVDTADVAKVVDWISKMPAGETLDGGAGAGLDAATDGAAGDGASN